MEQQVIEPIWKIQAEIGEKVLEVNRILSLLEAGLMKISPRDEDRQNLEDFLSKLLELEVVFYPELAADERYRDILTAIELYRRDKEAYARAYPALVYARYLRGSMKTPVERFHSTLEEVEEFLGAHPEYSLTETRVYPAVEVMIAFARALVEIGLRLDVLRLARRPVPVNKFKEVDTDALAGAIEELAQRIREL